MVETCYLCDRQQYSKSVEHGDIPLCLVHYQAWLASGPKDQRVALDELETFTEMMQQQKKAAIEARIKGGPKK